MFAAATGRILSAARAARQKRKTRPNRAARPRSTGLAEIRRATRARAIMAQVEFGARYSYFRREPYLWNRRGVRLSAAV